MNTPIQWFDAQLSFPKPETRVMVLKSFNHDIGLYYYSVGSDGHHYWDNKDDEILQDSEVDFWAHWNGPK